MTTSQIRVFLIDDHQLVLDSLRARLSQTPDFELVGSASSASDALPQLVATQPDVVALDVELPGRGLSTWPSNSEPDVRRPKSCSSPVSLRTC